MDYGTCDIGSVKLTTEASHANNPLHPNVWTACGVGEDGEKVRVMWDFSDAEVEAAGEDASALPFDDAHIWQVVNA